MDTKVISNCGNSLGDLRVVNIIENKGKVNALKQGVLASKGEFIAAIDSDALLSWEKL